VQSVSTDFVSYVGFDQVSNLVTKVEVWWNTSSPIKVQGEEVDEQTVEATPWVDESSNFISIKTDRKLNKPGEELVPAGEVSTCEITLENSDYRYSWLNGASSLYQYIGRPTNPAGLSGKMVRVEQGFNIDGTPETVRIFTGVIFTWREDPVNRTITLICRDMGYKYLQNKISTQVYTQQYVDDWIIILAQAAGFVPSYESRTNDKLVLDRGILPIPYCWTDAESFVDEVWKAAAADGGRAYFDAFGRLVFENATHWLPASQTVAWEFEERDYTIPVPIPNTDQIASEVTVEWAQRTPGEWTQVYLMKELLTLSPGESSSMVAKFDQPCLEIYEPVENVDYYANSLGGINISKSISIDVENTYAQRADITIRNNHPRAAAQVAFFQLRGKVLLSSNQDEVTGKPATSPLPKDMIRNRSVRGNPYIQTRQQANFLKNILAARQRTTTQVHELREVPGIPHLELSDFVNYKNTRLFSDNNGTINGFVIGIEDTIDKSGHRQTVHIMESAAFYDLEDLYIVGVSKTGGPSRMWY